MNAAEYWHAQYMRIRIEEHFTIDAGGALFVLRPKEEFRAGLGLTDDASWVFSTLDDASSWVGGFTCGLMYARISRTFARGVKAKGTKAVKAPPPPKQKPAKAKGTKA
jgi:hypothetical protein